MKVIDLLNKIANGEEVPEKIKIGYQTWVYDCGIDYKDENNRYLFDTYIKINEEELNEEVEIIEEDKKIEKIKYEANKVIGLDDSIKKINEIIDYINKE